jgi:hypothetical protein
MPSLRQFLYAVTALALAAPAADAQQDDRSPIATGRPSFATGPGIVPSFQIEAGYAFGDAGGTNQHTVGQVMLRLPANERLELRVGVGSVVIQDRVGGATRGFQDLSAGAKLQLSRAGEGGALVPSVAILPATTLPTADGDFGSEQLQPSANLILGWPVGERLQLLSNTIVRSRFVADTRFTEVAQGINLGVDLPFPTQVVLFHDQTEETDGDRRRQREGWPASQGEVPEPRNVPGMLGKLARS